ncbi:MAG: D-alanyl-D-alanine carboxypeptidase [Mogibacterium sp.]|nr:D-alanyl-D-alanine carboxypeptidase [Mogibacterium sp.]
MKNSNTARIRKQMVAIISVILILVTTIGYIALFEVYAEGENNAVVPKKAPAVSASSYMVMSGSTSEKVAAKHADRKMQPGKITMLMTAMVVLDNMYDDKELKNTVESGDKIAEYGETFKQGESASVGDLLNAMLVGGDVQAAELLAKYSASSRKIFVKEMNSKCMELGLMDTLFTNASGRYDIKAYSTAADLAVITQAAYRYQVIKDALAKRSVTIAVAENKSKKPREIEFRSTDPFFTGNEKTEYQYIKGGILGLVDETVNSAQFAAIATKDDMQMIVVLMDSAKENTLREATSLFEYADAKVTKNTIVKKGKMAGHARVRGGAVTRVPAYTETKGFAYVPPEGSDSLIETQVAMYDDLNAPLSKGDKVGEFRIYVADELKGTVDLIIKEDVPVGWYPSRFYISNIATIVIGALLFILLVFLLRVGHVKRRRAKRREAIRRARIRELARKQLEIDEDRKRREWNASGYEEMPPRTTDIRKEAINEEARKRGKRSRRKR